MFALERRSVVLPSREALKFKLLGRMLLILLYLIGVQLRRCELLSHVA